MATVPPVLILHVLLAACAAAVDAAAAGSSKVPAIYVFGDSTADVGNNNYLPGGDVPRANFPHNGVDFPTSRPTGRFSNGYNGVDFLGKLSRSFTHLWLRVLRFSITKDRVSCVQMNFV